MIRAYHLPILLLMSLTLGLASGSYETAFASQKWTIKGQIMVEHVLPELSKAFGDKEGVAGITVKVSARSRLPLNKWGTWNSWGKLTTKADGSFQVSENHGGDRRQFKVEILFDSDKLRIKEGLEDPIIQFDSKGFPINVNLDLTKKDWHEVFNDKGGPADDGRKAGVINLGQIFIKRAVVRQHADLWDLYHKVFNLFDRYGDAHSFQKKVFVKYPMRLGKISYANPLNNNIYIDGDEFDANILIHELMHIWEYERFRGEDGMAWQAIKHGTTHQDRENTTYVPGLEAFAEWSSYKILKEITEGKVLNFDRYVYKYPDIPLTREYIGKALNDSERVLANVDYTEPGWHSLFNILTHPYLDRVDFNKPLTEADDEFAFVSLFSTKSCPDKRLGYSLKELMSVWLTYPNKGIDSYMRKDNLDFHNFLDRAGAILPGFELEKIKQVKTYLNPNRTENPCS